MAGLSCNLLLPTSTLYSHDLSTLTLEGRPQVASSCLGPRDRPWNSWRECRGRHSWSSTNVKKQLKTKQKQKHLVYYLHLFAIIYCYCRMDASHRDHDVHTKVILQEAQWLASSNRAAQLKLQLRCCFAAHRSPNGLRHAILYEPGADLDDAKSPRRLRRITCHNIHFWQYQGLENLKLSVHEKPTCFLNSNKR